MAVELYNKDGHVCLAFYDLVDEEHDHAVQSNQFLISDHGHGALVDPGGNMTYNALLMAMQKYFPSKELHYILASHPDPDIIASVNKWFIANAHVAINCRVFFIQIARWRSIPDPLVESIHSLDRRNGVVGANGLGNHRVALRVANLAIRTPADVPFDTCRLIVYSHRGGHGNTPF